MDHSYRQLPSEVRKWNCTKIFLLLINIFNLVSVFLLEHFFLALKKGINGSGMFYFRFASVGGFYEMLSKSSNEVIVLKQCHKG